MLDGDRRRFFRLLSGSGFRVGDPVFFFVLPLHRRVPVVLDGVVGAAGQQLSNFGPLKSKDKN